MSRERLEHRPTCVKADNSSSGFTFYTASSSQTGSQFSSASFIGCLSTFSGSTTLIGRIGYYDRNTTGISGTFTIWAQPVVVEHQTSDLSLWASGSTTSESMPTPTVTLSGGGATITATNLPSTKEKDGESNGLSTGAKAGIAVGAILGFLLLLALTVIPIWRRKRRQHRQQAHLDTGRSPAWRKKNGSHQQEFLSHDGPSELNGVKDPVELDANDTAQNELFLRSMAADIQSMPLVLALVGALGIGLILIVEVGGGVVGGGERVRIHEVAEVEQAQRKPRLLM